MYSSSETGVSQNQTLVRTLAQLKKSLGFRSARSFYTEYLQARTRLDFNYSYYMKIEGGKIIPSPQIIGNLAQALEKEAAEALILAYCEVIFPTHSSLFQKQNQTPNLKKTLPKLFLLLPAQVRKNS